MTKEQLQRCEAELTPLVPREGSPAVALEQARSFNQSVADVRAALLEPARELSRRGSRLHELPACLEKAVAELAFWRRVLRKMYAEAFGPEPAASDYLLRYVLG